MANKWGQWILSTLITILISFIAWQSTRWSTSIDNIATSVIELNTQVKVMAREISVRSEATNGMLQDHEIRLRRLENGK